MICVATGSDYYEVRNNCTAININHVQIETCRFLYGKIPILGVDKVYLLVPIYLVYTKNTLKFLLLLPHR